MKLRPTTLLSLPYLEQARRKLRSALICARHADCPKLAAKIRSAIKSAGGAERHMQRRIAHSK